MPVQLIVPSGDRFISEDYYERAERSAPDLRRRTIAGSHSAPCTQPELIARWVSEHAAGAPAGGHSPSRPWVRGGGIG